MFITIEVNNRKIKAVKGETILSALNDAGIRIPTLCRLKDLTPTGACRICVVEVEGHDRLVTACSQTVEEWMKIETHSPRVINARKTIVELLLASHPDDCLYCVRNMECELQRLSEELNIRERRIRGPKVKLRLDQSNPSVVRELSKCILCGRCVRVCEEIVTATTLDFVNRGEKIHVGPAMDRDFNFSNCINCAQCVQVCPTGALHERHNITEVIDAINRDELYTAVQYSPLVPWALAEILGEKYSRDFNMVVNSLLRKIGFDQVYTSGFGSDIMILDLANQIMSGKGENPLMVSACPSWVKFVEQFEPEWISWLSTIKCPQQITGEIIKKKLPAGGDLTAAQIHSVTISPCAAMKFEARRDSNMPGGISDIDTSLTVRELARLVKLYGIDTNTINGEQANEPMAVHSGSAALTEIAGGITEAVIRELFFRAGEEEPEKQIIKKVRGTKTFREIVFTLEKREYIFAVVDGLTSLQALKGSIGSGVRYDMIEVMVCSGGCIGGGGLLPAKDKEMLRAREKFILMADESELIRVASKSAAAFMIENIDFEGWKVDRSRLFHTSYRKRDVLI